MKSYRERRWKAKVLSTACRYDVHGAKHAGTMQNSDSCDDGDRIHVASERKTTDIRSRREK